MDNLTERLKKLSTIARKTLGCSPQLHLMKDGTFRIALLHGNTSKANVRESHKEPITCVNEAIDFILEKRRPIDPNDQYGGSKEATHTIKPKTAW